jgi:multiphosphoryl transfer protein
VVVAPGPARIGAARAAMAARRERRLRAARERELPAVTRDGRRVRVLVNAAGAAEVRAGIAAGAEGVGLLRTEIAFLGAASWPSADEHQRALAPIVAVLGRRPTLTVRVLDFGGDKTPPFLRGVRERGIALLLAAPAALAAQLAAVTACAGEGRLRVLLPMVTTPAQVRAARAALGAADGTAALGAMVETPEAAARAGELAAECDFLSIGTNDLAHATLGSDRFEGGRAPAHHPRVLACIAQVAAAARATGIPLEVCGEAASDPVSLPLLVGLGVDELSVGAARVGAVRGWVRALSFASAAAIAERALELADADEVATLVEAQVGEDLREPGDRAGEAVEGAGRVGALGA